MNFNHANLTYPLFVEEYKVILMIAILTVAVSVILRSYKILIIQLLFFIGLFIFEGSISQSIYMLLVGLQLLLGCFLLYRLKKALDRNYQLVLEKTHKIPRDITRAGKSGSQSTFL
jgi:hypothetical protein